MSASRTLTGGVVLADGRVLVAGGQSELVSGTGAVAEYSADSAEVFDPTTGQWHATGSMTALRKKLALVTLADGKVLAVGGRSLVSVRGGGLRVNCFTPGCTNLFWDLNSAEVYNPATGAWTAVGHMSAARIRPTATLLADGSVLVTGGGIDTAERFDPRTGSWSAAGSTGAVRLGETATRLDDGRVLVCGGVDQNQVPVASCQVYDPRRRAWSSTAPLRLPVAFHTATVLSDGRVLVAGGQTGADLKVTAAAEVWSPSVAVWTRVPSLMTARASHGAVRLADHVVLVCGGGDEAAHAFSTCERFDPRTASWEPGPALGHGRLDFVMLALDRPDGQHVLAIGGSVGRTPISLLDPFNDVQPTATVEVYSEPGASQRP
ncbi:MAG: Kelch repeat-containing protein [Acidimicrobiales bacterium]